MKEIGGYFELELPEPKKLTQPGILVNSGRHALEYVLRTMSPVPERVWLPYYTCDVVLEPLQRLEIKPVFYHINENLEIRDAIDPEVSDAIIVNNYFGIKDTYVNSLVEKYGKRLIIDNAQAWYAPAPKGANAIYSPRKFFGIPDGGVAHTVNDTKLELPRGYSYDRFSHLIKRIDYGASAGYIDFKTNSKILHTEALTQMSNLTEELLRSIDFDQVLNKRRRNYLTLAKNLSRNNMLTLPPLSDFECPMVYPYRSNNPKLKSCLIDDNIFVATYWPNVFDWCGEEELEYNLAKTIIPIPIDQRYGDCEMQYIIEKIRENE